MWYSWQVHANKHAKEESHASTTCHTSETLLTTMAIMRTMAHISFLTLYHGFGRRLEVPLLGNEWVR
jgi:hypothetical protein